MTGGAPSCALTIDSESMSVPISVHSKIRLDGEVTNGKYESHFCRWKSLWAAAGIQKKISSVKAQEGVRVKSKSKFDRLLIGTSAIAMAVASAIAVAQENAQKDAAKTKRHADTFVDSVSASDVASLPDMSVAEALQRVPGVTVTRFPFGGASPDFPSPEGRGNLIRGLGFVRSEFNGRDAFSANGGRALDWSSIPPELVGGIDV